MGGKKLMLRKRVNFIGTSYHRRYRSGIGQFNNWLSANRS